MTLVASALFTGAVYGFVFNYRSDYLGHYMAGFGGTLLMIALLAAGSRRIGGEVVLIVLVAIGIGVVTEATMFKIAIFDPVDFANQSLGAAVAGAGTLGHPTNLRIAVFFGLLGLISLGAGFYFAFT